MEKTYISAQQLLEDSFSLGKQILETDFRPNFIVAVWRGGTPVGIAVQEMLAFFKVESDHISIRTSLYSGIDKRQAQVRVHGLDYLINNMDHDDSLLIVDDVFDTGRSIGAIVDTLQKKSRRNYPKELRIATPWFKPSKNKTTRTPDFYLHKTDKWLVFPHELDGLTNAEIADGKGQLIEIIKSVNCGHHPLE